MAIASEQRLNLTPLANPASPCPICGAGQRCRFDRAVAYCSAQGGQSARKKAKTKGWSRSGQAIENFAIWQTGDAIALAEPTTAPIANQTSDDAIPTFAQIAERELYQETAWICVSGKLYSWAETHFVASPDEVELRRIAELANEKTVETVDRQGKKTVKTSYATAKEVRNALDWVKQRFAISPDLVNPSGQVNCTNGILVLQEEGDRIIRTLEPHDPKQHFFLSPPGTAYDPNAPTEDCDRLLAALDPPEQQILLKTIAASILPKLVRRRHGRLVRAIVAKGVGSNGKDAHREAFSQIFGGAGFASLAFEDFDQYDSGRKFPLTALRTARVSWSSENQARINLDKSPSLKRAITGDPLYCEFKRKDQEEFIPKAVLIFNVNDLPNLKAGLEAIKSRYAVLSYRKLYKIGADPSKGEIEADSRFKYDPDFLRTNVLPALLNKLVEALQALMVDGIDYSPCDRALEEIQLRNSHLFEFALETGLKLDRDSIIPIGELWARLESWYRSTEVLTWQNDRNAWAEPIRRGDDWVKGANQVFSRFSILFPQIELVNLGGNRKGIKGLKFEPIGKPKASEPEPVPEPEPPPQATAELLQVGELVSDSKGRTGQIRLIDGDRAQVDGDTIFGWFALSELKPLAPELSLNGRASP
ncbi:hypothetical protein ACQ4M4_25880 [Leptolyngbya sp. AN02str]|uniref:hypothetical protein n=1 Tax=Leptolyngbya sp. AN02str TaxID=3423363 RepID=UPI003D3110FD